MDWIEIAVTGVDGEAAEALNEVIARYTQGGAVIEQRVGEDGVVPEPGTPSLTVRGYLADDERAPAQLEALRRAIWHLSMIVPLPEPHIQRIAAEDWSESWKRHYTRSRPGRRLLILPAWDDGSIPPEALAVRIDPGMAFGTGTHPSTQLCLVLMEEHLVPGTRVYDIGSGSGILSIAALRLGAGRVAASDIDPVAVAATAENAALNGVEAQIERRVGSADAFEGPFDLILINILAEIIVTLLPAAAARLAPDGQMILSGILSEREPLIRAALEPLGLQGVARREMGDWCGMVVRRGD